MNLSIVRSLFTVVAAVQLGIAPQALAREPEAPRSLFAYDTAIPLGVRQVSTNNVVGGTVHDVTFNALKGKDERAYVILPEGKGPFPGILWVHWLGEPETTNRTQFLKEASAMATKGVASVLVEAMWSEPGYYERRDPEQDYDNSIKQVVALRRGMDLLLSQTGIDASRVAFVGHDYGGMYGMLMAGADQRAKAYVYIAVAPSLADWAFFGTQPKSKIDYLRKNAVFELTEWLALVKNASTLLQYGRKDVFVAVVSGGVLAAAARTKDRKVYDAGHDMQLPQIMEDREAWLLKELGLPPTTKVPDAPRL